jgi:hypothetical protein
MGQNDSSYLADTPIASKLGPQLAMFVNEETGILEKFRPYAWPAAEWLAWVAQQLQGRSGKAQVGPPTTGTGRDHVSPSV